MVQLEAKEVIARIRGAFDTSARPSASHEPEFHGNEIAYLRECIETRFVSSVGPFVNRFEDMLAAFTGSRRAVATVNGTSALHVALLLAGVRRDDEVLIPAMTFVATANAVSYCGAVPHLLEHSRVTLGICPTELHRYLQTLVVKGSDGKPRNCLTGRTLAACVPMHTFGHPVDMEPLLETCAHYGIPVVEDAAESLGSTYRDRHTGTFGKLGILSFNGNKTITTGGGGAILTQDDALADAARHLTQTAKQPHPYAFLHDRVGYNYRMPNLNAALGCAQMDQLPELLRRKRRLADRYHQAFTDVPGMRVFREPAFARSNYWLNTLIFDPETLPLRERVLESAVQEGLALRPPWTLIGKLPMYVDCPRMETPIAEELERSLLNLPSSPGLLTPTGAETEP